MKYGFDDYIVKPVTKENVKPVLKKLLEKQILKGRLLMTPKIYNILYLNDGKVHKTQCSSLSLHKYIDRLLDDGAISIYMMEKFYEKEIHIDKQEKAQYYNSKYNLFYRQYKRNKITLQEFENIKNTLKKFKKECATKDEFKTQFEKLMKDKS